LHPDDTLVRWDLGDVKEFEAEAKSVRTVPGIWKNKAFAILHREDSLVTIDEQGRLKRYPLP
jgi:hypothetical protein